MVMNNMVVEYVGNNIWKGLSTDTKPVTGTPAGFVVPANALYIAYDISLIIWWNSGTSTWEEPYRKTKFRYIIFKAGSTYYCIDRCGTIVNSGSEPHAVCQYAVDQNDASIFFVPDAAGAAETWTFNDSVNILDNTEIESSGPEILLKRSSSGVSPRCIFKVIGTSGNYKSNWSIRNCRMLGPGLLTVNAHGVQCDYSEDGIIEECEINAFGNSPDDGGITMRHSRRVMVVRNNCYGNRNGIITGEPGAPNFPEIENCDFIENKCSGSTDDGIHMQHGKNNTILANRCYSNGQSGIDVLGDDHDNINDNICYLNGKAGIEVGSNYETGPGFADKHHTVTGNECFDNVEHGLLVLAFSKDSTFNANNCHHNGINGIRLSGAAIGGTQCSYNLFTGNIVEANISDGVYIVNGACGFNTFALNHVKNNGGWGILIQVTSGDAPKENRILHNYVTGNTTGQINNNTGKSWKNKVYDN